MDKLFYFHLSIGYKLKNKTIKNMWKHYCRFIFKIEHPFTDKISKNIIYKHQGFNTLISKYASIGDNCIIYSGVIIGQRHGQTAPTIGNNVLIGCNTVIIGDIKIGNNVNIGACSLILSDVPENVTIAGNPAKIIKYNKE